MKSFHGWLLAATLCASAPTAFAQNSISPAGSADPMAVWKTLQKPVFDPAKTTTVKNVVVERDRIHVLLDDGALQFVKPVYGVVYGAAFHGRGRLQIEPPNQLEAQQLEFFAKQESLKLEFSDALFSFTDNTFQEISGKVTWSSSSSSNDDLYSTRQQQREDLGSNVLPRVSKGVLSSDHAKTAFFFVDIRTSNGWVEASYDAMRPEEVSVGHWVDLISGTGKRFDTWMSFPAAGRQAADAYNESAEKADYLLSSYKIDATVTAGAELSATSKVSFETRLAGERVLLFLLDSNLRVEHVKDSQGLDLPFLQAREQKDRLQSFGDFVAVFLPVPTQAGQQQTLEFQYAGKRAIRKVGSGNYFCESYGWYPTRLEDELNESDFTTRKDFEITFHSPKKFTLVATGKKTSESTDGNTANTSWKSEKQLYVAGFAVGDYKISTEKAGNIDVDIYANKDPDDLMGAITQMNDPTFTRSKFTLPLGSLSPSAMAPTISGEMANTIRLFDLYFGPYPYSRMAVTNIPYSYGQGWPGLIYLSMFAFLDSTQKNILGIRTTTADDDFFRAHETSHQWWGHRVGWKSYHDLWLSEGFAEFSGNLYVQFRESQKEYLKRIRKALEDLQQKDDKGHRYDSIGPIWMGARLASSESPRGYSEVIYEKGGYVLHMLRWLLADPKNKNPDARFQAMMQDFTRTYDNKAASTEDFKAMAEKYMIKGMDLEGNHRMDWFFRQYVYGTGIPHYEFQYSIQAAPGGRSKVSVTLNRTGVPEGWMDAVPLYSHHGDTTTRIGLLTVQDAASHIEFDLPSNPEKLSINDNMDILAEVKQ